MGDEYVGTIEDLRDDMGFVQRGFLTATDADRKLWRRIVELEREVADLKSDSDVQSVETSSLWREVKILQDELRGLRQSHG